MNRPQEVFDRLLENVEGIHAVNADLFLIALKTKLALIKKYANVTTYKGLADALDEAAAEAAKRPAGKGGQSN